MDESERKCRQSLAVKKYRENNPEKYHETTNLSSAIYRATHPDRTRITLENWRKRNPIQPKKKRIYRIMESIKNNNVPKTKKALLRDIKILNDAVYTEGVKQ